MVLALRQAISVFLQADVRLSDKKRTHSQAIVTQDDWQKGVPLKSACS